MKIIIIYTHVLGKTEPNAPPPETYAPAARRFFETYQQFKPSIPHETVIINCNRSSWDGLSDSISAAYTAYFGGGWDCGAFQCAGQMLDCDLLVCMNAYVHFWRTGWLEPFVKAAEQFGPGLYAAMASYQSFPHLRTPCLCCHPKVLREYPVLVNNRDRAIRFESREDNISLWARSAGYPVKLVTEAGTYDIADWRKPDNIFRRGDQSNCLVWDRHTSIYAEASVEEKQRLALEADTLTIPL